MEKVSDNEKISKLVQNGIVVSFPDNGNLPGKALVRIKATDNMKSVLNNDVYVYIYNEDTNDFCVVDTNVSKSADNYYEFVVTHNSDYLVVNEKLDSKLIASESSNNVVSFQKSNKTYLMLIAIGVAIIVAIIIVLIILMRKKKKVKFENASNYEEVWMPNNMSETNNSNVQNNNPNNNF